MGASGAVGAGSALTAVSQFNAGRQNDKLARFNGQLADMQADTAIKRGAFQAKRMREQGAQVIGAQRVALAANGISVDSGTAKQMAIESGMAAELDALEIENSAALEALGYRIEKHSTRLRGKLDRIEGTMSAVNTGLRGAADTYQTYKGIKR